MTANAKQIDSLANALAVAKQHADNARAQVLEIEQKIIDAIGTAGEEGTLTAEGDNYQLKTVTGYTYNVSPKEVAALKGHIDIALYEKLFSWKPALNLKLFRALKDTNPEAFDAVVPAVTVKPKKIAVQLKELTAE